MASGVRTALIFGLALAIASCASDDKATHHRWNPNGTGKGGQDWHSPTAMLLHYDANHDGTLTRKELDAGLRADFDAADKKHTGCLDSEEVTAINEERTQYDESAASPLIDWKNRGCVDFDEFATMPRSLFEELDVDGDGELSPAELHPRKRRQTPAAQTAAPPGGGY
ncbi:MAG: hypothetical protein JOZ55_08435 [Alphaproteobacteria bacterium]|nr:hypothetical protein [Alphaproteobacteria bacterium]